MRRVKRAIAGVLVLVMTILVSTPVFAIEVDINDKNMEPMVKTALAELTVEDNIEEPLSSDNVKYNTWYYGGKVYNHDSSGDGAYDYDDDRFFPWCCAFIAWCANECGYLDSELFTKTASCTTMYYYLTEDKGFESYYIPDTTPMGGSGYTPVQGDIMLFSSNGAAKSPSFEHIGIIVDVQEDGWTTVEGNSSNRVQENFYDNTHQRYAATHGRVVHIEYPVQEPELAPANENLLLRKEIAKLSRDMVPIGRLSEQELTAYTVNLAMRLAAEQRYKLFQLMLSAQEQ